MKSIKILIAAALLASMAACGGNDYSSSERSEAKAEFNSWAQTRWSEMTGEERVYACHYQDNWAPRDRDFMSDTYKKSTGKPAEDSWSDNFLDKKCG